MKKLRKNSFYDMEPVYQLNILKTVYLGETKIYFKGAYRLKYRLK